jgi:hypothetical protein
MLIAPGMVVIARVHRGVSAVARVLLHEVMTVDEDRQGHVRLRSADASAFHCAFYSNEVLANGREPFNQASLAAYLPLSFRDVDRIPLPEYGCMLVEREADRRPVDVVVSNDGVLSRIMVANDERSLRLVMAELALQAGVPSSLLRRITGSRRRAIATAV